MANIAILGSSFSECLYRHDHENDIQKLPHNERILRRTESSLGWAFDGIPVKNDYENHWVTMLSNRYPQHTFHVFARGGSGWEYAQQFLYMLSNSNICDRVIIELQSYRAMILAKNISFDLLSELHIDAICREDISINSYNVSSPDYSISHETKNTLVKWYYHSIFNWGVDHLEKSSVDSSLEEKFKLIENKYQLKFTKEVVDYIARMIVSPVYIIRYQQYLLSLKNVWPKIFDKVGIWAFEPFDPPYLIKDRRSGPLLNVNKEIFNNKIQCFDETAMEEWIRKDPINNSIDSWKDKYFGFDGYHLNKEGMKLLVDFLLKQPSIQNAIK